MPGRGMRERSPTLLGSLSIVAGLLAFGALTHRSASQLSDPVNETPRSREPLKLHLLRAREPWARPQRAKPRAHSLERMEGYLLAHRRAGLGPSPPRHLRWVVFYGLLALFPAVSALVSACALRTSVYSRASPS